MALLNLGQEGAPLDQSLLGLGAGKFMEGLAKGIQTGYEMHRQRVQDYMQSGVDTANPDQDALANYAQFQQRLRAAGAAKAVEEANRAYYQSQEERQKARQAGFWANQYGAEDINAPQNLVEQFMPGQGAQGSKTSLAPQNANPPMTMGRAVGAVQPSAATPPQPASESQQRQDSTPPAPSTSPSAQAPSSAPQSVGPGPMAAKAFGGGKVGFDPTLMSLTTTSPAGEKLTLKPGPEGAPILTKIPGQSAITAGQYNKSAGLNIVPGDPNRPLTEDEKGMYDKKLSEMQPPASVKSDLAEMDKSYKDVSLLYRQFMRLAATGKAGDLKNYVNKSISQISQGSVDPEVYSYLKMKDALGGGQMRASAGYNRLTQLEAGWLKGLYPDPQTQREAAIRTYQGIEDAYKADRQNILDKYPTLEPMMRREAEAAGKPYSGGQLPGLPLAKYSLPGWRWAKNKNTGRYQFVRPYTKPDGTQGIESDE